MKIFKSLAVICLLLLITGNASAQLQMYGFFATRFEDVYGEPDWQNGKIEEVGAPSEWSYQSFNLMFQYQIDENFRVYANIGGTDGLELKNYWGEFSVNQFFNVRIGKTYRKFGLYNEILDAVPTYYGIEPPELFDSDHLILSRTSTVMIHGSKKTTSGLFSYSLSTDNGEGDPNEDNFPIGFDANYRFGEGDYLAGISGYTSGGQSGPDRGVGEGSPKSGVLPWMAEDKFTVFGGYFEGAFESFLLQLEYWNSSHDALRDPASVIAMVNGASPNANQMARFMTNGNVNINGDYDITTWYIRTGYSIEAEKGEFAPYAQWDYYKNPETIASKTWGGDNEAGAADDGVFKKGTIGLIFRPNPAVAFKLDGSMHFYKFHGDDVSYPEIRFDISYLFGQ